MRADYHMYYENFVWKRVLLFAAIFACLCSRLSSLLIPLLLFGFGGSRCFVCFFFSFWWVCECHGYARTWKSPSSRNE
jgi:hypothetical protein